MAERKLSRRQLSQLAVVGLAGWGASAVLRELAPLGIDVASNATAQALLQDPDAPRAGPPDATLNVVVFGDYQCPACRFASPALHQAAREDGRVLLIYKEWPIFGALSERSARVALASDRQGIYSEFHQALMKEPRRLEDAVLREVADASGGNWAQLENDVTSQREAIDRLIARTRTEAFTLGLAGTPAYLIGHRLVNGALNLEEFKSAFRSARAV